MGWKSVSKSELLCLLPRPRNWLVNTHCRTPGISLKKDKGAAPARESDGQVLHGSSDILRLTGSLSLLPDMILTEPEWLGFNILIR